ncbi:S-adenosyl-L-methionine-dependent methyltransferase [Westerdykella ornata]|uniref:DNA (cytosine-5-)-methyltransferase n=1 Tax=Westerdykella ornata TaxID=318751 RepID=A0A6A6JN11_WESOR|nr:S-adenosyl-L-methionine-dependent methyltransferase [Westerdykella ornata]KAF2277615.1 S-adenosyl-L-methionine-dependent methyltransferase [Westerdykella ornata]
MPGIEVVDLISDDGEGYDEEHDVFGYEPEENETPDQISYIEIQDDEDSLDETPTTPTESFPEEIEVPHIDHHGCGRIKPGDTVEMKNASSDSTLRAGDFLRVEKVIEVLETGEVKLRGYAMRRTKHLAPQFDRHLNELFMNWEVRQNDERRHSDQGLQDLALDHVSRKRECVLTNRPYPSLSFRDIKPEIPTSIRKNEEARDWIYEHGRLVCRYLNKVFVHKGKATYTGEVRSLYEEECDDTKASTSAAGKHHRHSSSVEILDSDPISERPQLPQKSRRYRFGDCFCGAGGASKGASNAGLKVLWGADNDKTVLEAYELNFPDASAIEIDIHELPTYMTRKNFYVDILNLSCPCQFWSGAHTCPGQNDQKNVEALYTVGPAIKILKPRIVSLEQTPGLIRFKKHRLYWRFLIHQLLNEGYNVRYTVENFAEFGLPQRRTRLLLLAAKRGIPLPPFPRPTHGPFGSGLKPLVSIWDALAPIRQLPPGTRDHYHQPWEEKRVNGIPYNPREGPMMKCITASGGPAALYFDGTRRFTPREASCLQGFDLDFYLAGSKTQAMRQVGNAFPPIMAELVLLSAAQTLEAFDHGLIDKEEDILDLYETLTAKGIDLNSSSAASSPSSPFSSENLASSSSSGPSSGENNFRYLNRLRRSIVPKKRLRLFGAVPRIEARPDRRVKKRAAAGFGLFVDGGADDDDGASERRKRIKQDSPATQQKQIEEQFWREYGGKTIELD